MGTTSAHGLPYPELTDVPDVPADMKELADAIETVIPSVAASFSPVVLQAVRTQNDAVATATWGTAVNLSATVPKGTAVVQSLFHWKSSAGYSWLQVKVNGVYTPPAINYIASGQPSSQQATTLVSTVAHPGGTLTAVTEFGFSSQDVWILNGSLIVVTLYPSV